MPDYRTEDHEMTTQYGGAFEFDERRMIFYFTPVDEEEAEALGYSIASKTDGEWPVFTHRARFEVCRRCEGKGSHTNPSIDGNGITASEMDELGDEFRADYCSGVYDVTCEQCHGKSVVPALDLPKFGDGYHRDMYDGWGANSILFHKRADEWVEAAAAIAAESEAERRMGC